MLKIRGGRAPAIIVRMKRAKADRTRIPVIESMILEVDSLERIVLLICFVMMIQDDQVTLV